MSVLQHTKLQKNFVYIIKRVLLRNNILRNGSPREVFNIKFFQSRTL